jgi:hypothetical protein
MTTYTYCKVTDTKATVTYTFEDPTPTAKIFVSKYPPIVITTEELSPKFVGGQCNMPYKLLYRNYTKPPFGNYFTYHEHGLYGPIRSIELAIEPAPNDPGYVFTVVHRGTATAQEDIATKVFGSYIVYGHTEYLGIATIPVNGMSPPDDCGNYEKSLCKITITDSKNQTYSDIGDCPITFNVTCGEECPPGTTKCRSTNYPGYCCLPCEPTKQSIIGIKNIVKSVNKGTVSNG